MYYYNTRAHLRYLLCTFNGERETERRNVKIQGNEQLVINVTVLFTKCDTTDTTTKQQKETKGA